MSKRLLVIDDDEFVRKAFTLALTGSGYEVETAESKVTCPPQKLVQLLDYGLRKGGRCSGKPTLLNKSLTN